MKTQYSPNDIKDSDDLNEKYSFRPSFCYVFDEVNPPSYRKVQITKDDGTKETKLYDVARRIFVD